MRGEEQENGFKIIYLTVLASVIVTFHVDMTKYIQQKQLKEVEGFIG